MIVIGLGSGKGWLALVVLGSVLLLTGMLDICLFGPLYKEPLRGRVVQGTSHN